MTSDGKAAVAGVVSVFVVVFVIMFAQLWFNNAATKIVIHDIEDDVQCALATSSDGVAIDCWRTD